MALKGTLKDFGISDILQLIGQQQKTGTLVLKSGSEEVHVAFLEGAIVRAESESRKKNERIGSMLVAAEQMTQGQLDTALEIQKRTLERLGDVLVSEGMISADNFTHMVQLQTAQTLYQLFGWTNGSYEFEAESVEADPLVVPLRAETVLMEGMRMVDEWPGLRAHIPNQQMRFSQLTTESALVATAEHLSPTEHHVFKFVDPHRTVEKIVHLAGVGEFEACKALVGLLNAGAIRATGSERGLASRLEGSAVLEKTQTVKWRSLANLAVVTAVVALLTQANLAGWVGHKKWNLNVNNHAMQDVVAEHQLARIEWAVQLFQATQKRWPNKLEELVEQGFLEERDLIFPYQSQYYYQQDGVHFVLLPPLK